MPMLSPCRTTTAQAQPAPRRHRLRLWPRRVPLLLIVAAVLFVGVGAIYQAIATEHDKRAYPTPAQLVNVGGHRLHIACRGSGSPTVVLEAAADMMSADWAWVQPEVAKTTRVCAYDRAGMGWSDVG